MKNRTFEKIKTELDKCILLCKNCHNELHYLENEKIKSDFSVNIKFVKKCRCIVCNKEYVIKDKEQKYCSKQCASSALRKTVRPTEEKLKDMVWRMPTTKIAKIFGVSDKAIEKWCRTYKIEKPQRGYWQKKDNHLIEQRA